MVTREPTDRFLSGFIDRCLRWSSPTSSLQVSESSIDYIAKSLRSGRTAHSTVTSQARVMLEDRLRTSPYLMELIVRIFYHDFKLFGYPLPDLNSIQSSQFKHDPVT
ncbi:hypothetical protein OSTOST_11462, partial [Ostertagia ostertagi]